MSEQTNKADFFEQHLVLTGKVIEMVLAAASQYRGYKGRGSKNDTVGRLTQRFFEPLNLAAAYAANPANTDLSVLADALGYYRFAAAQVLAFGPASKDGAVESLFQRGAVASMTLKQREGLEARLTNFEKGMDGLVANIYKAIGYAPGQRHDWLKAQTSVETPLTRHGRINKWRTFVRHTDWTACLHLLGVREDFKAPVTSRFASDVGVAAATELWGRAFVPLSRVSASEEDTAEKLPAGVTITSTANGKVEVCGSVEPMKFLNDLKVHRLVSDALDKGAKAKGVPLPPELLARLAARVVKRTCSFIHVSAAVAEVTAWMAENSQDADEVRRMVSHWMHEVDTRALKDKLKKNFTPEEQRKLAALFAEGYRPDTPVAVTAAK